MRAFTAISLPESVKKKTLEIVQSMPSQGLTMVKEDAMHITLHFFEEIDEEKSHSVIEAINSIKIDPFEADVRGISYFGVRIPRVIFAKVNDPSGNITKIFNEIGVILDDNGVRYDKKDQFVPHITIARSRNPNPNLKRFIDENSDLEFGSIKISEIMFIRSKLNPNGPSYTVLYNHRI